MVIHPEIVKLLHVKYHYGKMQSCRDLFMRHCVDLPRFEHIVTVALIRGSASFMYGCVLTSCVMSKGSQRDVMYVIDNSVIAKIKKKYSNYLTPTSCMEARCICVCVFVVMILGQILITSIPYMIPSNMSKTESI